MEYHDEISRLETAIKDLDLDYMRGLVSEDEYRTKMDALRASLVKAGGTPAAIPQTPSTKKNCRKINFWNRIIVPNNRLPKKSPHSKPTITMK